MPKQNKRKNEKYPALKPHLNLKTRYDLLDQDYTKDLKDKKVPHCSNPKGECKICNNPKTRMINPKAWLNKFNEEFVNDNLDRKDLDKNLHNTDVLKKDCGDRNNSRNRCIVTRAKASGMLSEFDTLNEEDLLHMSPEEIATFREIIKKRLRLTDEKLKELTFDEIINRLKSFKKRKAKLK